MSREPINYMGTHWLLVEDNIITVGLNQDSLDDVDDIESVNLPSEGEAFETDEICGELETTDGPINVFAPVAGKVVEVNAAVMDNPELIKEDPSGEGWLFRIEPDSDDELNELVNGSSGDNG